MEADNNSQSLSWGDIIDKEDEAANWVNTMPGAKSSSQQNLRTDEELTGTSEVQERASGGPKLDQAFSTGITVSLQMEASINQLQEQTSRNLELASKLKAQEEARQAMLKEMEELRKQLREPSASSFTPEQGMAHDHTQEVGEGARSLSPSNSKIQELQDVVETKNKQLQAESLKSYFMQEKLNEVRQEHSEAVEQYMKQMELLKAQNEARELEKKSTEEQVVHKDQLLGDQMKSFTNKLQSREDRCNELTLTLKHKEESRQALQRKVELLQKKQDNLTRQLQTTANRCDKLTKTVKHKEETCQVLQMEVQENLRSRLQTTTNRCDELILKLNEKEKTFQDLQKKVEGLQNQLERYKCNKEASTEEDDTQRNAETEGVSLWRRFKNYKMPSSRQASQGADAGPAATPSSHRL